MHPDEEVSGAEHRQYKHITEPARGTHTHTHIYIYIYFWIEWANDITQ